MPVFKFNGVDFIEFDSLLSADERLVRDNTRKFIEDNLVPIIEQCNREGRFPRELVRPMGELGFFGANLKGYGCAGMSNVEYGLVMQELERGDSGVRSFVSVQSALVMFPIYSFGSDAQKDKWLPGMAKGEKLGCFGLTEPDFGSNPSGMRTRAKKVGKEYVINGEKMWITSGSIADVAVIWAKSEEHNNRIRGFLVETDRPGFKADNVHGKWSLRASVTSGLSLQDVRIPEENLLPLSDGLKSPLMCLNQARYGIGWGGVGAAMACYDTALQYSKIRKQFRDQPIASHQLIQEKLAWMVTEITKAQLLVLQVGRLKDAGQAGHQHISMAKRNNVWMALECARMARDILGANGIADDYPVMRHMMNLESVKTYEGTHDIHALIIGESITGVSAFSATGLTHSKTLGEFMATHVVEKMTEIKKQVNPLEFELALEFVRVVEEAAIASAHTMGLGDRHKADQVATEAMRRTMDSVPMRGTIVIGEGERDEAPMLYIGEKVGAGWQDGAAFPQVDIAVDPLEGTNLCATGSPGAITVLAASEKGGLLNAPDCYMEKLVVGPSCKGVVDIEAPVAENLKAIAKRLDRDVHELVVVVLERPRHQKLIDDIRATGARIRLISDGDLSAGIAAAVIGTGVHAVMGIGGAPEGVITAAAMRCLNGEILARLIIDRPELEERIEKMGIRDKKKIYTSKDLAPGNHIVFAATGVTDGALMKGVRFFGEGTRTSSIVMTRKSGKVRFVDSIHLVKRPDVKVRFL